MNVKTRVFGDRRAALVHGLDGSYRCWQAALRWWAGGSAMAGGRISAEALTSLFVAILASPFVYECVRKQREQDGAAGSLATAQQDGDCGGAGIVVAPLSEGDNSDFTAEIAVDSMDACQGLIELFTAQLANTTSTLMSCAGGDLHPCWDLDPDQTVTTHCIDTTDTGNGR